MAVKAKKKSTLKDTYIVGCLGDLYYTAKKVVGLEAAKTYAASVSKNCGQNHTVVIAQIVHTVKVKTTVEIASV